MKKFNLPITLIFALFFVLLLIQYSFIYLCHDDYGYGSLSYIINIPVNGLNYGLTDVLLYLKEHYFIWGGRVLYFFIEIFSIKFGLTFIRIFYSLCLLVVFLLIYKISIRKSNISHWILALASVCTFGLFNLEFASVTFYWITAYALYVPPTMFFLLFVYLYKNKQLKLETRLKRILYYSVLSIVLFMASFSQEQIAIAALSYVGIYSLLEFVRDRKLDWFNIALCLLSVVGFAFLFLAPGNYVRMVSQNSLNSSTFSILDKIKVNFPYVIRGNFNQFNILFTNVFIAFVMYCSYFNIKQKNIFSVLNYLSIFSGLIIFVFNLISPLGYFEYGNQHFIGYNYIYITQLTLAFYSVLIYLKHQQEYKVMLLFFTGILSQLSLLLLNHNLPLRVHLIFEVICLIFIITVLSHVFKKYSNLNSLKYTVLLFCGVAFVNILSIMQGYYQNSIVNKQNHQILKESAQLIKEGKSIDKIVLTKLPNDKCTDSQPYQEGCDYILYWMKEYYDLPKSTEIIYKN